MQIAILGAGYVGLVTGACLAELGHVVTLVEVSPRRLDDLREGRVPFHEPGLQPLLSKGLAAGRLRVTDDAAEALPTASLVLVCVGTPLDPSGAADLAQVQAACAAIAGGQPRIPVAVRSTLPLGSTSLLANWLGRDDLSGVVTNPEFLRQGSAVSDFMHPARIVIGTDGGDENAVAAAVADLYRELGAPILFTTFASAEMIKNSANAFLATKLSFINEVADLCEAYGASAAEVVAGIGLDPRIGSTYLRPGIGFGGSCLPKELANMVRIGRDRGLAMPLMAGAAQTNELRAMHTADRLEQATGSLAGACIGVLGLSFKPDTDDVRYSPALQLISELEKRGAVVAAHDPAVPLEVTASSHPNLKRVADPRQAVADADIVVLATEWPVYAQLPWEDLRREVRGAVVFDGRNTLDHERLLDAGWRVIVVGEPMA